jgi:hypothetical protein
MMDVVMRRNEDEVSVALFASTMTVPVSGTPNYAQQFVRFEREDNTNRIAESTDIGDASEHTDLVYIPRIRNYRLLRTE